MKKTISILIYEKEFFLNSILKEQLSQIANYHITLVDNNENLFEIIKEFFFDVGIINLDDLKDDTLKLIKTFKDKNKNKSLIFYHDKLTEYKTDINESGSIVCLIKPFKINTLIDHVIDIVNYKETNKSNIYLMENLTFHPVKKIIHNNKTNNKEHLTEKETNLLEYLLENKNSEILKENLLISLWGINKNINTHTLETHLYRLRQKLNKLEPNLTFSLINHNGKYIFKNN